MRAAQCIVLNQHTDEDGGIVIRHACKLGLEGIVSKRLSKPYQSGRSGHWLKVTVGHAEREFMEHLSVGPDVGRADHLGPLLGFIGDELPEVGGRTRKYRGPSGFLQCTVFSRTLTAVGHERRLGANAPAAGRPQTAAGAFASGIARGVSREARLRVAMLPLILGASPGPSRAPTHLGLPAVALRAFTPAWAAASTNGPASLASRGARDYHPDALVGDRSARGCDRRGFGWENYNPGRPAAVSPAAQVTAGSFVTSSQH